jgi:hypothetical protein
MNFQIHNPESNQNVENPSKMEIPCVHDLHNRCFLSWPCAASLILGTALLLLLTTLLIQHSSINLPMLTTATNIHFYGIAERSYLHLPLLLPLHNSSFILRSENPILAKTNGRWQAPCYVSEEDFPPCQRLRILGYVGVTFEIFQKPSEPGIFFVPRERHSGRCPKPAGEV